MTTEPKHYLHFNGEKVEVTNFRVEKEHMDPRFIKHMNAILSAPVMAFKNEVQGEPIKYTPEERADYERWLERRGDK